MKDSVDPMINEMPAVSLTEDKNTMKQETEEEIKFIEKCNLTQSSSSQYKNLIQHKYLNRAIRALNTLTCLLLASVLFI